MAGSSGFVFVLDEELSEDDLVAITVTTPSGKTCSSGRGRVERENGHSAPARRLWRRRGGARAWPFRSSWHARAAMEDSM